jgi:histone chaperone ASF1
MSLVNILNIRPVSDYFPVRDNFVFDVALRTMAPLPKSKPFLSSDLQWKVIYIGSSTNDDYDQQLEEFEVPVNEPSEFQFQIVAGPPDFSKFPSYDEIFDVTALMIMVQYDDREFFRCSFLISHEYADQQPRQTFTEDGLFR